jgi:hypothetical protein
MVMVGLTIENAYGILVSGGLGFFNASGQGVFIHVGCPIMQFFGEWSLRGPSATASRCDTGPSPHRRPQLTAAERWLHLPLDGRAAGSYLDGRLTQRAS